MSCDNAIGEQELQYLSGTESTMPSLGEKDKLLPSHLIQKPQGDGPQWSAKKTPLFVYVLTCFAAIGGFLFGYDTGVVSGAMILVRDKFQLSTVWQELVVSVTIGTAILGSILGGILNDLIGRKPILLVASTVFTAGAVVMAVANDKAVLLIGRMIVGIGVGSASMTVPIYVAESAPPHLRGQLVTLNNVFITGGQFIAAVIDGLFSDVRDGWRYMLGLGVVPSIVMFFGCLFLPESPRWLISKGRCHKARDILVRIRGTNNVDEEFDSVKENCEEEARLAQVEGNRVMIRILNNRSTRRALLVGCVLQATQQLAGINTVMYYSATIINMAGVSDKKEAIWLAAVIAFGNFIFTFIGIYLVDRAGRRKLLLGSLAGVIFSLLLLGGAFYLAEIHDAYVTLPKPPHPQDVCESFNRCLECTSKQSCGFCYVQDSSDNIINASCVFTNDTFGNRAAYGPCSEDKMNMGEYHWAHEACPYKYAWLAVVALCLYIATFAPGMGPMPWTINSEIYPLWARSTGNACATAINWICNLFVSLTFLSMTEWLTRPGAFWFYAGIASVGWVFSYIMVPETKGKTLEEIQKLF